MKKLIVMLVFTGVGAVISYFRFPPAPHKLAAERTPPAEQNGLKQPEVIG